jgi:hypothetical protein
MRTAAPTKGRVPARLSVSSTAATAKLATTLQPILQNTPPLPPVKWSAINEQAPALLATPAAALPTAAVVVLVWTDAEWASLEHVFCNSGKSMTYANSTQGSWSGWQANWQVFGVSEFSELLFPVPTTAADLASLCTQFNDFYKTSYTLATLNVAGLDMGDPLPAINNLTTAKISLLTADSFLVGTSSGNLGAFSCVDMDDAAAASVAAAVNLTADDRAAIGRFELAVDARIDSALSSAKHMYLGGIRCTAALLAMGISQLIAPILGARWDLALILGIVAVPFAPIANDLVGAIQAASKALTAR